AKNAIVAFWQVSICEPGGEPGAAGTRLQKIRLSGSDFFSFGFSEISEYAVTGRSSSWCVILKRLARRLRKRGAMTSGSIPGPVPASDDVFATTSIRTE